MRRKSSRLNARNVALLVTTVGAAALSDAELISVDSRDFADMLRGSVETCFLLLGEMSQRLRGLIREIDELSLQSATCRVAGYLLNRAPEGADSFRLDVPKGVVASRLSVKPETFSRIVKNLSGEGILTVRGSRIEIHDREALRGRAEVCAQEADARGFYPCPPAR